MSFASGSRQCPKCGGLIPADASQGLCPKCLLLQASLPTDAGRDVPGKSAPPTREELAAAFPQLEILELIGQGGMGFVFKARQLKLERLVALKILPRSLAADPAFAERFTREGRVLARLNHPNIVTVHDFGLTSNGLFYLLMEFVDGVNLRQAMKAGRFTPAQALAIVPKICEALQFAHNEGVLHRDIKPENILLDAKGRVKIADFGIAKLVGELHADTGLTGTGSTLGTPNYMAPEQIENSGEVDHRADIYSLGVVFYEMLTGGLPIGHFALPSEKSYADPRLDDVVLRTLEKDRERRTQTADEVKTQVETIAGSASVPPMSNRSVPAPPAPAQPKPDRFWRWFALIVLAVIVIPIGLTLLGFAVLFLAHEPVVGTKMTATVPSSTSFETATNGVYNTGAVLDGWVVTSNEVGIVMDPNGAYSGSNYLALASGRIARTFATKRGVSYQLQYHGKGPGITDWWPADGDANDIIGAHNGTLQNITFDAGEVNQAFHFNGYNTRMTAPSLDSSGVRRVFTPSGSCSEVGFGADTGNFGTNDFTVDFWIRQPSSATGEYACLEKRTMCQATDPLWQILIGGPTGWAVVPPGHLQTYVCDYNNGHVAGLVSSNAINDGGFHHVALIRKRATYSYYVDGFLDSSTTASGIANLNNTAIFRVGQSVCTFPGVNGTDQTQPFVGDLDDLDLFNRALSLAEIYAIYHAGSLGKYSPVALLPNFQLTADGIATNNLILTNASGPWQAFTDTFVAKKSRTVIEFTGNAMGVLLDDIQFAPLPAQTGDVENKQTATVVPSSTGFELATNGVYTSGANLEGWVVTSNEVGIVTDSNGACSGNNYLALSSGRIDKAFATQPGVAYQLRYHARGPGITDWWPGDGNARDIIGTHNGTLQNMTFDTGKVKQAFHFKGLSTTATAFSSGSTVYQPFNSNRRSSEVDFGADVGNFGTGDFTIDFWIKQPPTAFNLYGVLEKRFDCQAAAPFWSIRTGPQWYNRNVQPGQLSFEVSGENNALLSYLPSHTKINDGGFHHVACIRNGATYSIYVDGLLDNRNTVSGIADLDNSTIFRAGQSVCSFPGVNGSDQTEPFVGDLDELDLFNRALSPAEIYAIYHAGRLGKYSPVSILPNFQVTIDGVRTNIIDGGWAFWKSRWIDGVMTNNMILTTASGPWQPLTHTFTAKNSQTTIEFAGNAMGVLLDDIQVVPLSAQ